MIQKEKKNTN